MRNMTDLELYYNKFNEEKRLDSRHGQVEFITSMKYIHKYIPADLTPSGVKILDIGAGTGRYSIALAEEGYDVTAVELVKYNLGILKQKRDALGDALKGILTAMQGNAMKLKKLEDNTFDVTLVFGPMYHLFGKEDKLKALSEAMRVTKPDGIILVAYCMNEYSVLTFAFKEQNILQCVEEGRLSEDYKTLSKPEHLYDYMRMEDIDELNTSLGLTRLQIISPDGPANYMRPFLNQLSEEEFKYFIEYQLATCERADLIGAGAHTVDILKNTK